MSEQQNEPIPKQEEKERMSPEDRAFHENMLRQGKGMLKLYEEWIKRQTK